MSSRCRLGWRWGGDDLVDLPGYVSLEAADGFAAGFAFGDAPGEVVAGAGVAAQSADGDAVERAIGLAVAAAVQPATVGFAGGGFQGVDPAQGGEGGLAVQSVGVVPGGDEQGRGVVGTDTAAGQQRGGGARGCCGGVGGK